MPSPTIEFELESRLPGTRRWSKQSAFKDQAKAVTEMEYQIDKGYFDWRLVRVTRMPIRAKTAAVKVS